MDGLADPSMGSAARADPGIGEGALKRALGISGGSGGFDLYISDSVAISDGYRSRRT